MAGVGRAFLKLGSWDCWRVTVHLLICTGVVGGWDDIVFYWMGTGLMIGICCSCRHSTATKRVLFPQSTPSSL